MFLCRRILFQFRIPTLRHNVSFEKRRLSTSGPTMAIASRTSIVRTERVGRKIGSPPVIQISTQELVSTLSQNASKATTEHTETEFHGNFLLETYLELRDRDVGLTADLPYSTYATLLRQACSTKSLATLDILIQDIINVYGGLEDRRVLLLSSIFRMVDSSSLKRATLLAILYKLLESPRGSHALSSVIERLSRSFGSSKADESDMLVAKCLFPVFRSAVQFIRVPNGPSSLSHIPPSIIQTSFIFMRKLLPHFQDLSLDMFQLLVDAGYIPALATQNVDSSNSDFNTIIYSALIRAALHWGWKSTAVNLLADLLPMGNSPDSVKADLSVETVYSLLDTPIAHDVKLCGQLIREIHNISPIPNSLIRQFYSAALHLGLGDEAEEMYSFSREPSVEGKHRYPPPQILDLPKLMAYLATNSTRAHLVRKLAAEVVDDDLPLPSQTCAHFIAHTAAYGNGNLAKALWKRYSVGTSRSFVVGDSALMIRLTSLFSNLIRRMEILLSSRSNSNMSIDGEQLGHAQLEERLTESRTFLDQVLSQYWAHYQPISNARHEVLTSLARACFIVGNFTEGLRMFKIMSQRKEVPDLHDFNVALSALAEQRPRSAASVIDRMTAKGLRPDATTFGTVLHHALIHQDMAIVEQMKKQLEDQLQRGPSSTKAIALLIRATMLAPCDAADAITVQHGRLQKALAIIKSLPESQALSSPQTGKLLVFHALRVNDPMMAFTFWKMLLKDSTDWSDREQIFMRRLILRGLKNTGIRNSEYMVAQLTRA